MNVYVVLEKPTLTSLADAFKAASMAPVVYGVYADETDAAMAAGQTPDRWYVTVPFTPGVAR
jgi:hypothetical protein